jgi:hypothetical protein
MRLDHGGTEGAAQEESGAKRSSSKRKLIDTGRNKMFAKRNVKGQFNEVNGVGESLNPWQARCGYSGFTFSALGPFGP